MKVFRHFGLTLQVQATGYSCRSQVKRMAHRQLRHPLQVLLARVRVGDEGRASAGRQG